MHRLRLLLPGRCALSFAPSNTQRDIIFGNSSNTLFTFLRPLVQAVANVAVLPAVAVAGAAAVGMAEATAKLISISKVAPFFDFSVFLLCLVTNSF